RLARAVGPEQAEELAGLDLQVDALERLRAGGVALDKGGDVERQGSVWHSHQFDVLGCPTFVDALEAIVLGIVQGLTEFLPISSTAHLRIVPAFFGWEDPGTAFTAVCQLGTMAAVVLYFRADLWRITRAWLASLRHPELRS